MTWSTAQLKCLHTNAGSVGDKQEELEATMLLHGSYNLLAVSLVGQIYDRTVADNGLQEKWEQTS